MNAPKKKRDMKRILGWILFASLLFSAVFTAIRLAFAPGVDEAAAYDMQRSDFVLMLIQCCMAIIVMMIPSFIHRRWSIPIPDFIFILYYIFLYCAVFLGEVLSFYYRVKHWDTLLHLFSGAMLGALGFILVSLLNENLAEVKLSPFFVALFAFCFSLAMGAVWEIYEFTIDGLMGLNMQKYMTETGEALIGREALTDTMKDIISDAASAFVVSVIGYFNLKGRLRKEKEMEQAA